MRGARATSNRGGRPWLAAAHWRRLLLLAAVLLSVAGCGKPDLALQVGAGFTARVLCALVFDSGMQPERVFDDYVTHKLGAAHSLAYFEVDRDARRVVGRGLYRNAVAIHREGLGCTLVADADEQRLRATRVAQRSAPNAAQLPGPGSPDPWPRGAGGPEPVSPPGLARELEAAVVEAFEEPEGPGPRRQTTAVVVVHRGRLIAERYAPGVGVDTPLLSWSMAKSVTATLMGLAAGEGRLSVLDPAPVPEWASPGDPRAAITIDQLLRMSSGLEFDEHYGAINDVSVMLFTRADTGAFAASKPLAHPPDTVWAYSSGTSNILTRILRQSFADDLPAMVAWSRDRLFDRIGMTTAFFEPDASGSFVGSSFVFASARDWARFGQLHLQDGVWEGERVLPEGWVDYVRTPTPAAELGRYGAHWWLNAGEPDAPQERDWRTLPPDAYAARGMSGQYVVVVPSAELVVVRLGLSQAEGDALHGIERLVARVLAAVEAGEDSVGAAASSRSRAGFEGAVHIR